MMTRDQTRAAMPVTSALIDDVREAFGVPAGIVARENGHSVHWPRKYVQWGDGVTIERKAFRK